MRKAILPLCLLVLFITFNVMPPQVFAKNLFEGAFILQTSGGGASIEPMQIDTTELNTTLAKYGYPTLGKLMWTYGGELFSETEQRVRYTDFYMTGSLSATAPDGKYTRLSWNQAGIGVDKMFHLMQYLALSVGGSVSYGGLKLQLTNAKPDDFDGAIGNPQQTILTASTVVVKPQIGIYVPIMQSVNIELKAGYYYSYMPGKWKLNQKSATITGGPFKEMHGMSLLCNINFGF